MQPLTPLVHQQQHRKSSAACYRLTNSLFCLSPFLPFAARVREVFFLSFHTEERCSRLTSVPKQKFDPQMCVSVTVPASVCRFRAQPCVFRGSGQNMT